MSKHDSQNDILLNNIHNTLDESARDIDGATLSRIRQARAAAVEKAGKKTLAWRTWLSGAAATACVLSLSFAFLMNSPEQELLPTEAELLYASEEDLELYEDLEFYEWLAHTSYQNDEPSLVL